MDHHPGDLLIACGWNWMISCRDWRGVTGGCAPKPEGESVYSIQSRTAAIHSCAPFLCCDQETSHNIITYLWPDMKIYISISLDIWDVSIYAFRCSNLRVWLNKDAIICAAWTQDSSSSKYKRHRCCSSRHYVYLCVYFILVITWHVCSREASEMWSVSLAHIHLKEINFWLLRKLIQIVMPKLFHRVVMSKKTKKLRL